MQINFHRLLWSYLPRVPIFLAMTVVPVEVGCRGFMAQSVWRMFTNREGEEGSSLQDGGGSGQCLLLVM